MEPRFFGAGPFAKSEQEHGKLLRLHRHEQDDGLTGVSGSVMSAHPAALDQLTRCENVQALSAGRAGRLLSPETQAASAADAAPG